MYRSAIKYLIWILLFFPVIVFLNACSDGDDIVDEKEPAPVVYDSIPAIVKSLEELESVQTSTPDKFKFAVMADSHKSFDNLQEAVNLINQDSEILFVLHAGDLTVFGDTTSLRETRNILSTLNCPFFTVPGNHESNSLTLDKYLEIFGETRYSFEFEDNKFLFFNSRFDNQNSVESVVNWVDSELVNFSDYSNIFIASHIAPCEEAYGEEGQSAYHNLMSDYEIDISIHGHWHSYSLYGSNTKYLICGPIMSGRTFCIVEVDGDSFEIEKVDF